MLLEELQKKSSPHDHVSNLKLTRCGMSFSTDRPKFASDHFVCRLFTFLFSEMVLYAFSFQDKAFSGN